MRFRAPIISVVLALQLLSAGLIAAAFPTGGVAIDRVISALFQAFAQWCAPLGCAASAISLGEATLTYWFVFVLLANLVSSLTAAALVVYDKSLSTWQRAAWVLAFYVVPFVPVCLYCVGSLRKLRASRSVGPISRTSLA